MLRRAALLLLAVSCAVPLAAKDVPPAKAKAEVRVVSVTGGVLRSDGKALAAGAVVLDGAELRLDAGSAVLDYGGEGRLMLSGPGWMTLDGRRLTLLGGGLLSVMSRLKGRYSVATPVAVAAVRGTEFYVEARADGSTYLCLCEGSLVVTGAKGLKYKKGFKADHHSSFVFERDGKNLKSAQAPMTGHHDEDIEALR